MVVTTFFLVPEAIAKRSGTLQNKYRTVDNRFILDNRDLRRIQFTAEEYLNGLQGVEQITKGRAEELIKENNYKMGNL